MTDPQRIQRGTPAFRRANLALFSGGFATFALLYSVQPLLPVFAREFHVSPAETSLAISLTTVTIAVVLLGVGSLSERHGRKGIMTGSLLAASIITLVSAAAPRWWLFLGLRTLAGIAFAGFPAVSMAYLGEEMSADAVGLAMGLSIGGNGLGGMTGRLVVGFLAGVVSWRVSIAAIGALGLVATWVFWKSLPPSRHFAPHTGDERAIDAFLIHFRDARLIALFALGFLLMGSFVTTYNYVTYYLLSPRYALSQSTAALVFAAYPIGTVGSTVIGHIAGRAGRERVLRTMILVMLAGASLTLLGPLPAIFAGVAVFTFGFFGGHAVASSAVGLSAARAKGHATSLYLFFYYLGSSVAGALGGFFWTDWGWPGVVAFVATMLLIALAITRGVLIAGGEEPPLAAE